MREGLIKVTPLDGRLPRQSNESYILVDTTFELELRHFKAMLVLSAMRNMDLEIPENAGAAVKALDRAGHLLSMAIADWHWLDRQGVPHETEPQNNQDAFESLSMDEINWMLEAVSALHKKDAVSEGT